MRVPGQFGNFGDPFCDSLARWIGDRRVLETFAGNGLLASKLAARGINVVSTSLPSEYDSHASGFFYPVIDMDAVAAVEHFGDECDILLMSWPTTVEATTRAALLWGTRPIVFIGEVTDFSLGSAGLGGCATDAFFEITKETSLFESYEPVTRLDRASVRLLREDAYDLISKAQVFRRSGR